MIFLYSRCETRPGPEFVVRKYTFYKNTSFHLLQFHYGDPSCSLPQFVVTAVGKIASEKDSWIVPGGTDMIVVVKQIWLRAYKKQVAEQLHKR